MYALFVVYLLSGQFIVGPDEQAFVLRFGRLVGDEGEQIIEAGRWHWAFPKPVDKVVRIPVRQARTVRTDHFWVTQMIRNTSLLK